MLRNFAYVEQFLMATQTAVLRNVLRNFAYGSDLMAPG